MINIETSGMDNVLATLDSMAKQIETLGKSDMAAELTEWQAQDMRRRYPNTNQEDDKTVSTEIWPRSRLSLQRKRRSSRPVKVFVAPRLTGGVPMQSVRPILRSELFTTLVDRMNALMGRVLQWRTKA